MVPAEILREASVEHAPGRTVFHAAGGTFTATVTGDDGGEHAYPVEFVVGVQRMQMLVTRMDDGRLQVLPGILDRAGDRWFDYTDLLYGDPSAGPAAAPIVRPGEASFWTGPDRSFDARCARCHTSGYLPLEPAADGRGPRSSWRSPGVDCEACHGAGGGHAERFRDPAHAKGPDPILRLHALDRDTALGVCLACHMEGEPVRHGFRPGEDVFEYMTPTLLDADTRVDPEGRPRELIYEGLSFLSSRCATAASLRCTDCHDPHGREHRSMLKPDPVRMDAFCAGCHETVAAAARGHTHHDPAGSAGRCVACHMPMVTIERGHGAVHDHTIGIPRPEAEAGSRDACTWCHAPARGAPAGAPALPPSAVREARESWWPGDDRAGDWSITVEAGRRADPSALIGLFDRAADTAAPRIERATAVQLIGRYPPRIVRELLVLAGDGDSLVRRAVMSQLAPLRSADVDDALLAGLGDRSDAVRSAAARAALSGWDRIRGNEALRRAVLAELEAETARVPEDHLRWFRLGAARQVAGDVDGALEAYDRKLQLDPAAGHVRRKVEELRARKP